MAFLLFPDGINNFDSIRRRALAHLYDRRRLVKELAHNEYDEAKATALEAARAADQPLADVPPLELRPWRTETSDPVEATER